MPKRHKRIILVGPACGGKTFIKDAFTKQGFINDVSYTSRPPRDTEKEGIDYHFIPTSKFTEMIKNGEFYEFVSFGGNFYGTSVKHWETSDVFILETDGVSKIHPEDRQDMIMYVNTPMTTRASRMLFRGWDPQKIADRILTDQINFENFTDFDIEISSEPVRKGTLTKT